MSYLYRSDNTTDGNQGCGCRFALKPQYIFGRFVKKNSRFLESGPYHQKAPLNPPTIVLNDIIIPINKISLCILPMAECSGGPRTFWYHFGYFLTIWAFLSKHRTIKLWFNEEKIISFDFHHIPKLSIGFKLIVRLPTQSGPLLYMEPLDIVSCLDQGAFPVIAIGGGGGGEGSCPQLSPRLTVGQNATKVRQN